MHAVQRLITLRRRGAQLGLERVERALAALGLPQQGYAAVHIAGTNGKGSTAAMVAQALRQAGYRVGLYTSPHLMHFTERIQVDGKSITAGDLAQLVDEVLEFGGELTFFEATTVVGLMYFSQSQVDVAVVEVGLGGRLDATNVLQPLVSVITRIDRDHTQILGDDLVLIAQEKAGIIKPHTPIVTVQQQPEVLECLAQRCADLQAPLIFAPRDYRYEAGVDGTLHYHSAAGSLGPCHLALSGVHQLENAAAALATLEQLARCGWPTSYDQRLAGLSNTRWPGRLERIGRFVLDCAHNPAGARVLAQQLVGGPTVTLVFGAMRDKHAEQMLGLLVPHAKRVIMTQVELDRAYPALQLKQFAPNAEVTSSVAEALSSVAQDSGPIVITGSAYVVGRARQLLLGENADPLLVSDPLPSFR